MTVLVTGSAGRIGRAIYVHLANLGYPVRGVDQTPCSTADLVGDLCNGEVRRQALEGVTALVHTAALHAPHVGLCSDSEFERINVQLTQALVTEGVNQGLRQLVFTSTTALYGHASKPTQGRAAWVDEQVTPQPRNVYHRSNLAAESWLRQFSQETGLPVTVLRISRCFPEAVDTMAVFRLSRGIDARDVACGHELALRHALPGFTLFNLSGATPFNKGETEALYRDAAALIRKKLPRLADEFKRRGWGLPASLDRVYDAGAATTALGWQPQHGVESVLALYDQGLAEVLPPGWQAAR
ncbi:NAD(P)-dependent oxidoreductase [Ferrimonas sediminicola]|uniref:NAD(P)-dependent oxidoreductase n=1 Tax=Ferrimonas sediminicola TaxID=2569538 RepID=A0A4U1BHA1_9GAMM|nr:NAD(P)-dependent oxidoreductase [Ferrimonas sediminicola]TKB50611.1 NAD(P)-dependent oxidoreductase [Ferrimonas sediminicola]